ncbi:MAG: 50S ribosomal protein L25, partial [Alphaproteobacteria bacterium]|nr:50S ribosomal protein L25 [Alphaproteobacteria bacterium]
KDKKMADLTFDAKLREKAGKGAARACRREGRIPAVIYGGKQEPVMISLDPVQVEKALDMVGFYDADIEIVVGSKKYKVVCQDVQFHPVSDAPLHLDFLRR